MHFTLASVSSSKCKKKGLPSTDIKVWTLLLLYLIAKSSISHLARRVLRWLCRTLGSGKAAQQRFERSPTFLHGSREGRQATGGVGFCWSLDLRRETPNSSRLEEGTVIVCWWFATTWISLFTYSNIMLPFMLIFMKIDVKKCDICSWKRSVCPCLKDIRRKTEGDLLLLGKTPALL